MAVKVAENCSPAASVLLRGLHKTKGVQGPSQMKKKKKKLWYICVCVCVYSVWAIAGGFQPVGPTPHLWVQPGVSLLGQLQQPRCAEWHHVSHLINCLSVWQLAVRYLPFDICQQTVLTRRVASFFFHVWFVSERRCLIKWWMTELSNVLCRSASFITFGRVWFQNWIKQQ